MPEQIVSLEEALRTVSEHARALRWPDVRVPVALDRTPGRVLAEEILAQRDLPPFDRSTRDGFAVRAADLAEDRTLRVLGLLRAGEVWTGAPLGEGEAIEIMTGAPLPAGADCVLMVEHVIRSGDSIRPQRKLRASDNVVSRGAEARQGDVLARPGVVIDAGILATAASAGYSTLEVYAPVGVAILATGDELVELTTKVDRSPEPLPHQIFNSNSHALAAMVECAGGAAIRLPIARDTLADLRARLDEALAAGAGLLLLSGGVSAGQFDLVETVLAERGAEFFFTGVRIQPGKPVVFGRIPREGGRWLYFFGLPGNPVSTEVCFHLFAATMVRRLAGRTQVEPQFVGAMAAEAFEGKPGLVRLLPCRLESSFRETTVRPVEWQGSGDTTANARANGYCVVEEAGVQAGAWARVLLR